MKTIKFKTITKKQISDTVTPVGLYLRLRDVYSNTLLLESSDYHSKEESFSFIAIEPIVTIKTEHHSLSLSHNGIKIAEEKIGRNFHKLFQEYSKIVDLNCDVSLKAFNGLYGYSTYDSVQYFENITFKNLDVPSAIPLLQYSFYRFIIAINPVSYTHLTLPTNREV